MNIIKKDKERNTRKLSKSVLLAGAVLVLLANTCIVHAKTAEERMQWFKDAGRKKR